MCHTAGMSHLKIKNKTGITCDSISQHVKWPSALILKCDHNGGGGAYIRQLYPSSNMYQIIHSL